MIAKTLRFSRVRRLINGAELQLLELWVLGGSSKVHNGV